jgi:hypothetical protein
MRRLDFQRRAQIFHGQAEIAQLEAARCAIEIQVEAGCAALGRFGKLLLGLPPLLEAAITGGQYPP